MNEEENITRGFGIDLRMRRKEVGFGEDDLARQMRTGAKYIRALEEEDFAVFGAKVYAQGFLKKMLSIMGIAPIEEWMRRLDGAWDADARVHSPQGGSAGHARYHFYLTPKLLGIGITGILFVAFLLFLGFRVVGFTASPPLAVEEPRDSIEVTEPEIVVKGTTEKESKLTVNGRELTIDARGHFEESIELQYGVNQLRFLSENRFGKKTSITRVVVVK